MKTSATNRKLRVLITSIKNESLVPRPEFQRRLVWKNDDKLKFLETVLLGYPFPEIFIAAGDIDPDTGEGTEMLVDGQQRVTTLYQYFIGSEEINLSGEITPYKDLRDNEKNAFLEYEVVVRDLGQISIQEIKNIFERINLTKYSLNAMEIHNARFDGEFKRFAENFAQHDFFENNKVFSTNEIRRMKDLVFCLTVTISILSTYFNREDELEQYLEKYNDEFEMSESLSKELNAVINKLEILNFDSKSRAWKKSDLLTLFVETYRAIYKNKIEIDWSFASKNIHKFYEHVDNKEYLEDKDINDYRKATTSATNDRSSRITRGDIVYRVLNGNLNYLKTPKKKSPRNK